MVCYFDTYKGEHRVLKKLLDKGLDVEATLERYSEVSFPLMYRFMDHQELGLVKLLVEKGHGVNHFMKIKTSKETYNISPLNHAIRLG